MTKADPIISAILCIFTGHKNFLKVRRKKKRINCTFDLELDILMQRNATVILLGHSLSFHQYCMADCPGYPEWCIAIEESGMIVLGERPPNPLWVYRFRG